MKKTLTILLIAIIFVSTSAFLSTPGSAFALPSGMSVGVDYWNGFKASVFLNRDSPLMSEAGIKIVKLVFTPSAMSNLASLVPAITNAKFEVLGVLCNRDLLRANNINGWGNWVYNTVSAYKNYVKVWEVWNEPDWDTGFGSPGDPVKYTSWLKAAYSQAKQADPTCRIIGVSISAVFSTTLSFLTAVYNNGGQPYMDAVSVHPYCANLSPLPPAQTSGNGKAYWKTQDARNIMVQKGDASKPIWITEMGWNTNGGGTTGSTVTEAVQAKYFTDALNYARTNWNWLEAFIVYQWQDGGSIDGGGSYFGLLREDGTRKPSFYAIKTFTSTSSSPSSSIIVTTPNGGQNWARGSVHTITWTSTGSPGAYVKIELLKGGVLNRVISSSTANDGSTSWTISSTQTLGTDYKIRITSTSITSITDSSDNNFAVTR